MALEELIRQGAEVVAVVARWDDPSPGQWYPSVTRRAEQLGLHVLQPEDVNADDFVSDVQKHAPDLLFTAFYPKIFRRPLLAIAPEGSVNLHFAPLPRYRGSFPGAWAIINGERRHGVTLHYMNSGVDSGDVIDQEPVDISPDDTGFSLYEKCQEAGLVLVRRAWPKLASGTAESTPQSKAHALYYDRSYPYSGVINFGWTAQQVCDYVRAMTFQTFSNPFTFFRGRKLTIGRCRVEMDGRASTSTSGQILRLGDTMSVQAGSGEVEILEFQDDQGNLLSVAEAVTSNGLAEGDFLGR